MSIREPANWPTLFCETAKALRQPIAFRRHKAWGGNATQWRFSTCATSSTPVKFHGSNSIFLLFFILPKILYQPVFGQQSLSRSWCAELWHLNATKLRPTKVLSRLMDFAYGSILASSELRLLQPLAVDNRVLRFKTRRVQRASKTPYTAISYTWGNEEATEVIYLDNRPFHVRPNLWSCLYYMAQAVENAPWDYVWADAICINQTNDAERSSQVRLMDQMYRDAVCVSVWLGLVTLPEEIRSYLPTKVPTMTLESDGFDWADSIVELSNRPYWSRVWVIQEFLLGKQVELYCSNSKVDWLYFQEMLAREAGIQQFYDADGDVPQGDRTKALAALPLVMGRHIDKHPEVLQPLYNLLIDHHKSNCKDPRDRVFALLGLIPTDERQFINIYFPDYSMTEDHVAIITLAHLTQFPALSRMQRSGVNITPDSEELFLGLGVESKPKRRKLLRRAKELDYLAAISSQQMVNILAFYDPFEEDEGQDADELQDMDETERPRSSNKLWLTVSVISALFVIWLMAKNTELWKQDWERVGAN